MAAPDPTFRRQPPPTARVHNRWDATPGTRWMRANLFSSIGSTITTLILFVVLGKALLNLVSWGILNAVWTVPGSDTTSCRAARGIGACWAVIPEKYRFILFGTYPYDQQWRPALAVLVFIALFVVSSRRSFWRKELVLIWAGALSLIGLLMWGGVPGLPFVSQERQGGLPLTLVRLPPSVSPSVFPWAFSSRSAAVRNCRRSARSACSMSN